MVSLEAILANLQTYCGNFFQFMFPLPLALYLLWRWGRLLWTRSSLSDAPEEKFILFLSLMVVGNIFLLDSRPPGRISLFSSPLSLVRHHLGVGRLPGLALSKILRRPPGSAPHRHQLAQYPPDGLVGGDESPFHNDPYMLTYPNLPLKLFLTELSSPYPDVNQNLIQFFQTHAQPGDTILTTYGDLPLQFYTSFKVLGGLQKPTPLTRPPDWLVLRWYPRWDRDHNLNKSEVLVRQLLANSTDYRRVVLGSEDEIFGNQPDPFFHHFIPPMESLSPLTIYEKKSSSRPRP